MNSKFFRSRAGRYFYGTENETLAGWQYWKKELGADHEQHFEGVFFHVFRGKKMIQTFFKNIVASALKSCIKWKWENQK